MIIMGMGVARRESLRLRDEEFDVDSCTTNTRDRDSHRFLVKAMRLLQCFLPCHPQGGGSNLVSPAMNTRLLVVTHYLGVERVE